MNINNIFCGSIFSRISKKIRYFGDESNLHGIGHMLSMSYIPMYKRIFWLLVMSASGFTASRILQPIFSIYSGDAVSYLVDTNYIHFDTPFPAVTVCQYADTGNIKKYLSEHHLPKAMVDFFKEVSIWNVRYCRTCASCKINSTCLEDFVDVVNTVRSKCPDILSNCWWDRKLFDCCDQFRPIMTEYGECYVFNSRLTGNDSVLTVNRRRQPSLLLSVKQKIGIRVHSPDDMVFAGMENVLGQPVAIPFVSDYEIILKAEETLSDQSVSSMSRPPRTCLYEHERPSFAHHWTFMKYTYDNCRFYCRALAQVEFCNCTHHFMPRLGNYPMCDIQGLTCLGKHRDLFSATNCDCPMKCEEVLYKLVHIFETEQKNTEEMVARGSQVRVKLVQLPSLRVRRVAIRETLGLVVDIGGVIGVFFGASLLSIIEIIYILCIRRAP
ncbi:pickpocket protein 19-like [Galleria mellonella]|uniref:Pickpocket protein 19-like n=1 Tax=Galleria mellonella TaxID=7137 RepID=A0ABM3MTJ9_GALME|nr:pickpocket protein 19-like [Galleria mellonella]